ncbi:Fungal specific transcription factor domain-containing [Fusarium albosuccineum]|uniref:Fungal specific transcription factor domain-containing n=1 Tax=Fusarium albosuccineum TaxID=1237068 RepID=A0A8H4P9Z1_9HYPO|nr:Fungal specific transcription factor domain-containing [Fusarium albosuccineum]
MFRFVTDEVGGIGSKRKKSARSCGQCKKRHRRCDHAGTEASAVPELGSPHRETSSRQHEQHGEPAEQREAGSQSVSPGIHISVDEVDSHGQSEVPSAAPPRQQNATRDAYLRFVGDLSPEASFLANSHAERHNGKRNASRHDYVGVWLGQKPEDPQGGSTNSQARPAATSSSNPDSSSLPSLQALRPSLRQECIATLPPAYEFGLLSDLFFAKIDPIFPILRGDVLGDLGVMESVALKQCICLVAAWDPSMKKHLRLPHTERVLSPPDFRTHMASAVNQSLNLGFINDKMILLQICALMAMYVEKPGCSELSTYFCSQAVQHAQTLGLHVGWPQESAGGEESRRIFWCVWVLDRLNAATNGRPILMHKQDMDKRVVESFESQAPSFKLMIGVTQFLDDTISLYRPHATFPDQAFSNDSQTFEDLVEATGALDIGNALLASLEMFYLSVVILRSRPTGRSEGIRTPSSELQWFCATSIVSIASEEFKSTITYWPILPYSISMAVSVAYKTLRYSRLPYNRKRAYVLFHSSCEVLDELSRTFLSARAVARLAADTVQEVERVTSERNRSDNTRDTTRDNSNGIAGMINGTEGTLSEGGPSSGPQLDVDSTENRHPSTTARDRPLILDPISLQDFGGEAGIFNNFDPSFDLGRIDAVFSANLNPTVPGLTEDWPAGNGFL